MKAAVVHDFQRPLEIEDVPKPTPGWETLCESQRNTGYSVDGSYAEYVKASAAFVVRVPDGIDVNARQQDPVSFIQEMGGADSVIATAASAKPLDQAFRALRRGGTLVLVGLPAENQMQLPIFESVLQGINVVGSIVGTRVDLAEVFELHRSGRTHVSYERRSLEQVNEAFADVEAGRSTSRLVFGL